MTSAPPNAFSDAWAPPPKCGAMKNYAGIAKSVARDLDGLTQETAKALLTPAKVMHCTKRRNCHAGGLNPGPRQGSAAITKTRIARMRILPHRNWRQRTADGQKSSGSILRR